MHRPSHPAHSDGARPWLARVEEACRNHGRSPGSWAAGARHLLSAEKLAPLTAVCDAGKLRARGQTLLQATEVHDPSETGGGLLAKRRPWASAPSFNKETP